MAFSDVIYKVAEGNPGALSVCGRLDYSNLTKLHRMGITGSMVWVAYKDICKEDIEVLKDKIEDGTIEEAVKATPDYKWVQDNRPMAPPIGHLRF